MKPAGIQNALNFLAAVPGLAEDGLISAAAVPAILDCEPLCDLGARNGYRFSPEEMAEAFRVFARAKLVSTVSIRDARR